MNVTKFGVPINPVLFRIRKDLTWQEVVKSQNALKKKDLSGM